MSNSPKIVKWFAKPTVYSYYSDRPLFSWLARPEDNEYHQVSGWHGCRETFVNTLVSAFGCGVWSKKIRKIDPRRLRFAVNYTNKYPSGLRKTYRDRMIANHMREASRLLRVIEKYKGWPLTKITPVIDEDYELGQLFIVTASAKWMSAPQLLSFYLLMFRLARFHNQTKEVKKIEDDTFTKLAKSWGMVTSNSSDKRYITKTHENIKLFLDNAETLFLNDGLKENYLRYRGVNGFYDLLCGCQKFQPSGKRWNKLLEKRAVEAKS